MAVTTGWVNMFVKIPAFETLRKVDRYKESFFKPGLTSAALSRLNSFSNSVTNII
jgi:hypothetical protein